MAFIEAKMAGTIYRINVSPGEKVEIGQPVIILESMKMEIPIECETAGTVKEVRVQEGDFVNEGDVLISLE
ncbi:acetyl-CoA carboxylase biotin carboxyl carrier protein subunit [Fervidibacillus halotolerans]|uniref:Acetyl-CoA carboxylase biotin carboxyl carrier protein subunit n=1 Tax=Fervidibacillus halotolerans TaxID=2980027 RepID=A0A9E8RZA0_9BACI|nr:acetyl-CoA carboxylase biotin carboxyl carrier protein subunit [Fervidibacillus halotolerans]WAA13696.1 acetyl-CoA carboxylase biotin carboxyl carrier protein subunit [Fervidibacillus halotolerans]